MLTLVWETVIITLFVIIMITLLVAGVREIFFGIKERDIAQIAVGVMLGLVFLMIVLGPFVDTKKCLECNESYPLEYQYCPNDGTRLEE